MPFTVSHAIIAVPLRRAGIPVAAVAIGSMAPDAVLFAPFLPRYESTHSLLGVVSIDLAVSVVILAAWWWLVRPAWTRVAPRALRDRLPSTFAVLERVPLRRVPGIIVAIVIGSATHVLWDGFTHAHGWAVQRIPSLTATVAGQPWYSIVQDLSSVCGLLALVGCAALWYHRRAPGTTPAPTTGERVVRDAVAGVALTVVLARIALAVLVGGRASDLVVTAAFVVPSTVGLALVVGATLVLLVGLLPAGPTGRSRGAPVTPSELDGQERRQVGP